MKTLSFYHELRGRSILVTGEVQEPDPDVGFPGWGFDVSRLRDGETNEVIDWELTSEEETELCLEAGEIMDQPLDDDVI